MSKLLKVLSDNKIAIGSAVGLGALAVLAYKIFTATEEEHPGSNTPNTQVKLSSEYEDKIQQFKIKVNARPMRVETLKELFDFIVVQTHKTITEFQNSFKQERRALKNVDFKQYLEVLSRGLVKMQELSVEAQFKILEQIGMSRETFETACMANPNAFSEMPPIPVEYKEISVNDLKEVLEFQKTFLAGKGEEIIAQVLDISEDWDPSSKSMLPGIFSMIISDQIFEQLHYDEEQIEHSMMKYESELTAELSEVRDLIMPIIRRLSSGAMNPGMMDPSMMMMDPSMMHPGMLDPSMVDPAMMREFERMSADPAMMEHFLSMMGGRQ